MQKQGNSSASNIQHTAGADAKEPLQKTSSSLLSWIRPSSKVLQFVVVERVLGLLARAFDVALVFSAFADPSVNGAIRAFVVFTPAYFVLCAAIVIGVDLLLRLGLDLTVLDELLRVRDSSPNHRAYLKRACRWVLQQRRTIFWVGSWFYLDPDYVTLLLRNRKRSLAHAIATITFPSTIVAMLVWTPGIWIAVNAVKGGYTWASWILE